MLCRLIIIVGTVVSLSCSFGGSIEGDGVAASVHQADQTRVMGQIQLTRIAPAHETGKFSFSGTALLENGKILAVGYDGENIWNIRISTDGGQTWEIHPFTKDTDTFPDSIYFADNQHGWIGGAMGVFRTTDGGGTWKKSGLDRYLRNTKLSFYGLQVGYLAGKNNIEGAVAGELWTTRDGGQSWTRGYLSREWHNPFSVEAITESIAVAIFNENQLVRTLNAGNTWEHVKSYSKRTNTLKLDSRGQLWAVGPEGTLLFSTDNGLHWDGPMVVPVENEQIDWLSVAFVDKNRGYLVGEKGAFATTRDGGNTWEKRELNVTDDFYEVLVTKSYGLLKGSTHIYKFEVVN